MDFVEIGQYIAKNRKNQNISQEQMATDINISRATLSNFENGKASDIGLKKVLLIVDYLGLQIELKPKSRFPIFEEVIGG